MSGVQPKIRPITNLERRRRNKYIIISHIGNFSKRLDPMIPELRGYMPLYTLPKLNNYYRNKLGENLLPFHYLVSTSQNGWQVSTAAPLDAKSDLITRAVDSGYLDTLYDDAIVIAIQDDYTTRIPDIKSYEVLSANIIAPLKHLLRLGSVNDTVLFFDEAFDIKKYEREYEEDQHNIKYPYSVKPMRYFSRVDFNLEARRFA